MYIMSSLLILKDIGEVISVKPITVLMYHVRFTSSLSVKKKNPMIMNEATLYA